MMGHDVLEHGLEVSKAQEELVKLNLSIKTLNGRFDECMSHRQMSEWNATIRQELDAFRKVLGVLRSLSNRQTDPEATKMLVGEVDNHADQMAALQAAFRQANLRCIARLDKSGRNDLMMTSVEAENGATELRHRRAQMEKEDAVRQSGQATDKLASISRQLADTVERSSLTVTSLAESSQTVTETRDELTGLGSIVGQSRRLITKYARRETTDKVLILFAVAFFFAVVFYILRKRVLGPLDPFALVWTTVKSLVLAIIQIIRTLQAYVSETLL